MNRLDIELVKRNLVLSRSKAQLEIKSGNVLCDSKVIVKPSFLVSDNTNIELNNRLKYVSKGGLKLEKAINEFNISLEGKTMIDIGSSTGGFSDCALKNNISKIYAIDVGSSQLVDSIRNNPKVEVYENTDFRNMDNNIINDASFASIDISFISVSKIIDKISTLNLEEIVCLIKPEFECGKDIARLYKGVILNKDVHIEVINNVISYFNSISFFLNGITYSPICGGSGNIEYLAYFVKNKKSKKENINNLVNTSFKVLGKSRKMRKFLD